VVVGGAQVWPFQRVPSGQHPSPGICRACGQVGVVVGGAQVWPFQRVPVGQH
jgi:hypothetical protein